MGFSIGGLTGSNSSAKKAAQLSFAYQKQILQNQHQWEMQDLEKAGLNPALTLGDSALSGSHASAPMPNMGGGQDALGGLINSAVSMYSAKKNADTGDTQAQLNLAQAGKTIADTKGVPQQIENDTIRAIASQIQANAMMKNAQIAEQMLPENIEKTKQETSESKTREDINKGGMPAKIFGTGDTGAKNKTVAAFIAGLLPYGRIFNAGKKIYSARNFGKFLKGL